MILFCDTSALVKLYVREDGTDGMVEQAGRSDVLAVCRVAWVEFMSALARRAREQPQDAEALAEAHRRLIADWPHYLKIEVTQDLVEHRRRVRRYLCAARLRQRPACGGTDAAPGVAR